MRSFLDKTKIYTTKDGFNSYILCGEDPSCVTLVDPISFDLGFYTFLRDQGYFVTNIIMSARWFAEDAMKLLKAIYNPHINLYDPHAQEQVCYHTHATDMQIWTYPALGARMLECGDCLFIGPLEILSDRGGVLRQDLWKHILSLFSQQRYLFSCYGPPETLSSLRQQKNTYDKIYKFPHDS